MGLFCLTHNIAPFPNELHHCPKCSPDRVSYTQSDLDRAVEAARKEERSACEKIARDHVTDAARFVDQRVGSVAVDCAESIAYDIRGREGDK